MPKQNWKSSWKNVGQGCSKINVSLSKLPRFHLLPGNFLKNAHSMVNTGSAQSNNGQKKSQY